MDDAADNIETRKQIAPLLQSLAAHCLLKEQNKSGLPLDPVARFHLGNGARLENINAFADLSPKGRKSGYGVMVNYAYDTDIEANHEAYAERGTVVASSQVKSFLKALAARAKSNRMPQPDSEKANVA
jgi:malonyl-CoA decarboxylase